MTGIAPLTTAAGRPRPVSGDRVGPGNGFAALLADAGAGPPESQPPRPRDEGPAPAGRPQRRVPVVSAARDGSARAELCDGRTGLRGRGVSGRGQQTRSADLDEGRTDQSASSASPASLLTLLGQDGSAAGTATDQRAAGAGAEAGGAAGDLPTSAAGSAAAAADLAAVPAAVPLTTAGASPASPPVPPGGRTERVSDAMGTGAPAVDGAAFAAADEAVSGAPATGATATAGATAGAATTTATAAGTGTADGCTTPAVAAEARASDAGGPTGSTAGAPAVLADGTPTAGSTPATGAGRGDSARDGARPDGSAAATAPAPGAAEAPAGSGGSAEDAATGSPTDGAAVPTAGTTAGSDLPQALGVSAPAELRGGAVTAPAAPPAPVPTPAAQVATLLGPVLEGPDGTYQLSLELFPDELGPVQVEVLLRGGEIRLALHAAGEAAQSALRSALPDLRADLLAGGLSATSLSVDGARADTQQSDASPSAGQQSGDSRPRRQPSAQHASSSGPAGTTPLPRRATSSSDAALDLRM